MTKFVQNLFLGQIKSLCIPVSYMNLFYSQPDNAYHIQRNAITNEYSYLCTIYTCTVDGLNAYIAFCRICFHLLFIKFLNCSIFWSFFLNVLEGRIYVFRFSEYMLICNDIHRQFDSIINFAIPVSIGILLHFSFLVDNLWLVAVNVHKRRKFIHLKY